MRVERRRPDRSGVGSSEQLMKFISQVKDNVQVDQNVSRHLVDEHCLVDWRLLKAKGKDIDRGKMWTETHKRKEAARKIGNCYNNIRSLK
ncbi:hypothetical protein KY285_012797 [Solanum tuberosum]|nr:hypothetical protein KY285_012797 [Solanum tuberosum]